MPGADRRSRAGSPGKLKAAGGLRFPPRPFRRGLFFSGGIMSLRLLFAAVWLASSALGVPPLTTIQDVLYKADGTRFNGTVTVSWTSFQAMDNSTIATQSITVKILDGNLRVQLVPTTTSTPTTYYSATYNSNGRIQFTETWSVPSSAQPLHVR